MGLIKRRFSKKDETRLRERFFREESLEHLIKFALDEKRQLQFLLTGIKDSTAYSKQGGALVEIIQDYWTIHNMLFSSIQRTKASTSEEYGALLQEIKPAFSSITGIYGFKDPEIKVFFSNNEVAYDIVRPALPLTAISGAIASAPLYLSCMVSAPFALAAGILFFAASSALLFAMARRRMGNSSGFSFMPVLFDRIYVAPAEKLSALSILTHEYSHNIRFKNKIFSSVPFLEEGIATSVAGKVMAEMSPARTDAESFARHGRMAMAMQSFAVIMRLRGISSEIFKYAPFGIDTAKTKEQIINDNSLVYSCGASAVHLAEYKYGKGIYKDLFNGKYDCLLD